MIWYNLFQTKMRGNLSDQSKSKQPTTKRIQNAFVMSILMVLTWAFGFLAIEDYQFIFHLIFCLCSSLQGLIVFLLFCVRQEDVSETMRSCMHRLCCKSTAQSNRTKTASDGVSYSEIEFGSSEPKSKLPYSDVTVDLSAAIPMLPISPEPPNDADNPSYDKTGDATKEKALPSQIINKELFQDSKIPGNTPDSENKIPAKIQVANVSALRNLTRQEENEELRPDESDKLLQENESEELPGKGDGESKEREQNKDLPGQRFNGLPQKTDEGISGHNNEDDVNRGLKAVAGKSQHTASAGESTV